MRVESRHVRGQEHRRRRWLLASMSLLLLACGLTTIGTGPTSDSELRDLDDAGVVAEDARTADGNVDLDAATDVADGALVDSAASDGSVDPYTTRISTGLFAFYGFEENDGATVNDAISPAYDLSIADTSKVTWHPHYLEISNYTSLSNAPTFTKLVTEAQATNEITVEAWVNITGVSGGGGTYGRLVSIIQDATNRDIDMGLKGTSLWAALGSASVQIEQGPVPAALSHIVLTRSAADQMLRLYLNGALFASAPDAPDAGAFSAYRMFVANSFNADRGIKGDLHLLAFYRTALTPEQIRINYAAGPDPIE